MSTSGVTRIARRATKDEFVLVHTKQQDLKTFKLVLDATEGENAYTKTITRNDFKKVRARAFQGSDEELEAAILWIFLRHDPTSEHTRTTSTTEAAATVTAEDRISLSLRRRIEGITSEICTFELRYTEDDAHAIELFDWTGEVARQLSERTTQYRDLQADLLRRDEELKMVRCQLDNLIGEKTSHENALLEKFRQLLNSKKLKIRDQQRLLAIAKVDPSLAKKVKSSRGATGDLGKSKTKAGKRKAPAIKEESESSEGFEDLAPGDTDETTGGVDKDDDGQETPQQSDDGDTEEEQADIRAQSQAPRRGTQQLLPPAADKLPPRRELPFNRKDDPLRDGAAVAESADDDQDDDTEEEL